MKNYVYPCKPKFYYIKVGFQGVKIILACFRDERFKLLSTISSVDRSCGLKQMS